PTPAADDPFSRVGDSSDFGFGSADDDVKLFSDEDEDADAGDDLFGAIPADIRPTRLPGTIERSPLVLRLLTVLLVVLNVGAVGFLIFQIVTALTQA
ncbi:MAG: hypothetical protein HC834_07960, partial [Rhodospirillales bacterium]|nr:hypothetical protein [Rhodospirillales bacterium]